jgi:hypothetical protein
MFGDTLYPDDRSITQKINERNFAESLGGKNTHGYGYIDMGNMNINSSGHGGDEGKLPWHPTFSNQSVFADNYTGQHEGLKNIPLGVAGRWEERQRPGPSKDIYYPSQEQMQQPGYLSELQRYFDNERGRGIDDIVLPIPYKQDLIKM